MSIRLANAPCSWGVLEFDAHATAIEYSMVLDEIAASGYTGTELGDWGFMPVDPARLGDEVARRSLALVGAFVPVALSEAAAHGPGIETAVRTATLMRDAGFADAFIVLADQTEGNAARIGRAGRVTPADGLSAAQWDVVARGATAIALSKQRSHVPIVCLTDTEAVLRQMCLLWGVTPLAGLQAKDSDQVLQSVEQWGKREGTLVPGDQRFVSKRVQDCNWFQALEGGIDSAHISFLHAPLSTADARTLADIDKGGFGVALAAQTGDTRPRFEVLDTDYGVLIGARRGAAEGGNPCGPEPNSMCAMRIRDGL